MKFRAQITGAVLVSMVMGLSAISYAGEVSAPNLKLKSTYLKTTDVGLSLSTTPVDAVSPTTINCQAPGPCILSIELASQFNSLNPADFNVVAAIVAVDGSTGGVLPNGVLGLTPLSTAPGSDARSFIWITKPLPLGPHSVQVQLFVVTGSAASADRTLKIDVFGEQEKR